MKDLSAPITVGGRHWGGLRLAYRPREFKKKPPRIRWDGGGSGVSNDRGARIAG
jgi:hypothetical protein